MARAVFRASTAGAAAAGRQLQGAARELDSILRREVERNLGKDAVKVFRRRAPKESRRLADSIRATPTRRSSIGFEVEVSAINPDDGYDYLQVTRVGHRRAFITSSRLGVSMGNEARGFGPVQVVAGYSPSGDWVAQARPEVDALAAAMRSRVDRQIRTRLL